MDEAHRAGLFGLFREAVQHRANPLEHHLDLGGLGGGDVLHAATAERRQPETACGCGLRLRPAAAAYRSMK
jgi:hypothetical protein